MIEIATYRNHADIIGVYSSLVMVFIKHSIGKGLPRSPKEVVLFTIVQAVVQ